MIRLVVIAFLMLGGCHHFNDHPSLGSAVHIIGTNPSDVAPTGSTQGQEPMSDD